MEKEKLERISELTKKSRTTELSAEEKAEREQLRMEYRRMFTENFEKTLDNTYILDDNGNKTKLIKKK